MLDNNYKLYYEKIIKVIPENRVFTDELYTIAYGTDASLYRLIPKIVIKALNENELIECMRLAREIKLPITFRTAGTSLSGQASSDSILVALNWGFKKYTISENADSVLLEPGVIGGVVNTSLKFFNKKIGPDPASIDSAMIGGIINNNSSGMCCGVEQNSYKSVEHIKIMLYDGTILDTRDKDSVSSFRKTHKNLLDDIKVIRDKILDNEPLSKKIKQKYKIKNTTGYSLNAFVDYKEPLNILKHLIVGSEGTLAVLLNVTLKTVDEHPKKASAMIYYRDIYIACKAVELMKTRFKKYIFASELFDRMAIKTVENKPKAPKIMKTLDNNACCILVETRAFDNKALQENIKYIQDGLSSIESIEPIEFSDDPKIYSIYWNFRKGLIPSLGEIRKAGTAVVIEDVAFPIEHLAQATLDTQALFAKYGYKESFVMGHALDGNLHLVFAPKFDTKEDIKRYDDYMKELCDITANKYNGSLKAEHSTGRNVAPFVEMEWGSSAYELMKDIKKAFDPLDILNTGVLINDDPSVHIKNLKQMPITNSIVDKCIECGFCESECPSRNITLTPRQRIVVNREMSRLRGIGDKAKLEKITSLYKYGGEETCATCSMCEPACPVSINTGNLTKYLRSQNHNFLSNSIAYFIAKNFATTLKSIGLALLLKETLEKIIAKKLIIHTSKWLNKKIKTPIIQNSFPKRVLFKSKINNLEQNTKKVVYYPSCINRTMSAQNEEKPLFEMIEKILKKSGYEIIYPDFLNNLCCGMPFSSKGYNDASAIKYNESELSLLKASHDGKYPILMDTSPCFATMKEGMNSKLDIYEPISFIRHFLLDNLDIKKQDKRIAIHITCSSSKMGLEDDFIYVANSLAKEVVIPSEIKCCGFAGDRGFSHPELNESALGTLRDKTNGCDSGYSNSLTCEIGLSEYAKANYSSIFYLLDEATNHISASE